MDLSNASTLDLDVVWCVAAHSIFYFFLVWLCELWATEWRLLIRLDVFLAWFWSWKVVMVDGLTFLFDAQSKWGSSEFDYFYFYVFLIFLEMICRTSGHH